MAKQRADQMLVDRGLADSCARAQALILAGSVYAGDRKVEKAGQPISEDVQLTVRGRDHPWVSRGGIKLDHALTHFRWDVAGQIAIDVGSKLLQNICNLSSGGVDANNDSIDCLFGRRQEDKPIVLHNCFSRSCKCIDVGGNPTFLDCPGWVSHNDLLL